MTLDRFQIAVSRPGVTLRGSRIGEGPPLILLHGGPGCADYFAGASFETWLAKRFTVITYDQRGAGKSRCDGPFSIEANIDDLDALREHIGASSVALLGHSSGAVLAAHFAAAHRGCVDRLILLSPAGIRSGWRAAFDATLRERFTPDQMAMIQRLDEAIRTERDPQRRESLYRDRFNAALPAYVDPAYRDRAPVLRDYNREANVQVNSSLAVRMHSRDWERRLVGFDRPVAIVHGCNDPIPWSVVDDYCEVFPAATVVPLKGIGHFPWLEDEAKLRTALEELCRES